MTLPGGLGRWALWHWGLTLLPSHPAAHPGLPWLAGPLKPGRRPLGSQFPFSVTSGVPQSFLKTRFGNSLASHLRAIAARALRCDQRAREPCRAHKLPLLSPGPPASRGSGACSAATTRTAPCSWENATATAWAPAATATSREEAGNEGLPGRAAGWGGWGAGAWREGRGWGHCARAPMAAARPGGR